MNKFIFLTACSLIELSTVAFASFPLEQKEEGAARISRLPFALSKVTLNPLHPYGALNSELGRAVQRMTQEKPFIHKKILGSQLFAFHQQALILHSCIGQPQEDNVINAIVQESVQTEDGAAVEETPYKRESKADLMPVALLEHCILEPEMAVVEAVSPPVVSESELIRQDPLEQGWHVVPDDVEPGREDKGRVDKLMKEIEVIADSQTQGLLSEGQD